MFFFKDWLVDHWCIITIFLCFANLIDRGLLNTAREKDGRKTANKYNWNLVALFWWSRYLSICSKLFIHETKWGSEISSRPERVWPMENLGLCGGCLHALLSSLPLFMAEAENQFDCWKNELVYYWWGVDPLGFPLLSAVILKAYYYDNLLTS